MNRTSSVVLCLLLSGGLSVADDFPAPPNTGQGDPSPISPQEALAAIKLPPGFRATLFAAEPEVQNPIAMTWPFAMVRVFLRARLPRRTGVWSE